MQLFYILCFIAAFSLFLWQSVSDARQSVVQQTMLLVIIISYSEFRKSSAESGIAFSGSGLETEVVILQAQGQRQGAVPYRCNSVL